jgi:hypothetical protein
MSRGLERKNRKYRYDDEGFVGHWVALTLTKRSKEEKIGPSGSVRACRLKE